jgi:hypothetical protein
LQGVDRGDAGTINRTCGKRKRLPHGGAAETMSRWKRLAADTWRAGT